MFAWSYSVSNFKFVSQSAQFKRQPLPLDGRVVKTTASQKCTAHDLEVIGLNPSRVELGVCSTSV